MAGYPSPPRLGSNRDSLLSSISYEGSFMLKKNILGAQGTTTTVVCNPPGVHSISIEHSTSTAEVFFMFSDISSSEWARSPL